MLAHDFVHVINKGKTNEKKEFDFFRKVSQILIYMLASNYGILCQLENCHKMLYHRDVAVGHIGWIAGS